MEKWEPHRYVPAASACVVCGASYQRSAWNKRNICSKACRNEFNYNAAAGPASGVSCLVCATPFTSRFKRARYCSDRCYEVSARKRLRVKGKGLDVATLDRMINESNGRCAICRQTFDVPHLDHCHDSIKPRGVLCKGCNSGLGMFGDDIGRLYAAIEYLKRFQEKVA